MDKLARRLGRRLKSKRQLLVTAESCTGGWAAQAVTAIAGSSEWFERGFVTYSNASKHEVLGVAKRTLKKFGAVSEQTAREMARGALRHSRASIAVSVTGIAGPGGGSAEKPVGMVCFAWAASAKGGAAVTSETLRLKGGRDAVRRQSVAHALRGILKLLE